MNYYTVCPDCGYKLLKAGDGSKHATKATGKEQVPPVAFCVKPHASPCASLRRIGHRNSDASLHSAIPSSLCSSLRIPLSAPTLRASAQACRKKRQVRKVFLLSLFCPSLRASPSRGETDCFLSLKRCLVRCDVSWHQSSGRGHTKVALLFCRRVKTRRQHSPSPSGGGFNV